MSVRRFFLLFVLMAAGLPVAYGDENVVQEFSGSGTTTTGLFKVQDKWEVRWNARQVVSVAVMSSDGTIVAGAAGVLRGSLFLPSGGQYYFKVSDGTTPVVAPPATNDTPAPAAVASTNDAAKPLPPPPPATPSAPPVDAPVSWHLQVVEVGASVASTEALTVYTPNFMMPDTAVTPAPAPPPEPPPPVLTDEQVHSVVTIKGDNAQGFGFLVNSPDGTFVAAHLHLLAANPNVKIYSDAGTIITPLSIKAATDRDLALFTIKDDHYHYLPLSTDATTDVAVNDPIIIPDAGQMPPTGKPAKVQALLPDRLDFENIMAPSAFGGLAPSLPGGVLALNSGDDGMPVIHVKSGNALAIMTQQKRVDLTDNIAQAWTSNPTPGFARITPFYGLRLVGVPKWEPLDLPRFLAETLFLKQFHDTTRCLDSYLNGRRRGSPDGPPDSNYFLNNAKLHRANDAYKQLAGDAANSQRLEAARELGSDLVTLSDTDLGTLQGTGFYSYNQLRAQEELTYRKALRKEIDDLSSNIVHLDAIARMR